MLREEFRHRFFPPYFHDPNLMLYLPFNRGLAVDRSGHKNHGVIYGATKVAGKIGDALSFDGVDDYVEVPDVPSLRPASVTVMAWIYPFIDGLALQPIAEKFIGTTTPYSSYYLSRESNVLCFSIGATDDTWNKLNSGWTIPVDTWSHVAGIYDGANLKAYSNGVLREVLSLVKTIKYVAQPLYVARWGTNQWFKGIIDEVRIFNRTLSAAEIQRVMFRRGI